MGFFTPARELSRDDHGKNGWQFTFFPFVIWESNLKLPSLKRLTARDLPKKNSWLVQMIHFLLGVCQFSGVKSVSFREFFSRKCPAFKMSLWSFLVELTKRRPIMYPVTASKSMAKNAFALDKHMCEVDRCVFLHKAFPWWLRYWISSLTTTSWYRRHPRQHNPQVSQWFFAPKFRPRPKGIKEPSEKAMQLGAMLCAGGDVSGGRDFLQPGSTRGGVVGLGVARWWLVGGCKKI